MITTNLTGNLGNHMWQYAVCRMIAEHKGYDWGINSTPSHDYFNGKSQMEFMEIDYGKPVDGIINSFHERWIHIQHVDIVNIAMLDKRIYDIEDNTVLLGENGAYGGLFQCEDYLIDRKSDVEKWFSIKPEYKNQYDNKLKELGIELDENLCVINFRGGEYRGISTCLLRKEYWKDATNHMLAINPFMVFLAITDDPELCKEYMPFDIQTLHIDAGFDFYVVNQAHWLIISNSSFGWWAAWLNKKSKKTIAPKYWARHNVSNGYWALGNSYTREFTFMDREGKLFNYDDCLIEATEFYKKHNII
jgi:hypothetical protein